MYQIYNFHINTYLKKSWRMWKLIPNCYNPLESKHSICMNVFKVHSTNRIFSTYWRAHISTLLALALKCSKLLHVELPVCLVRNAELSLAQSWVNARLLNKNGMIKRKKNECRMAALDVWCISFGQQVSSVRTWRFVTVGIARFLV